jgi:hypothetical protein
LTILRFKSILLKQTKFRKSRRSTPKNHEDSVAVLDEAEEVVVVGILMSS